MTEELLAFLWKHKLYAPNSLQLSDGTSVEVIHPGEYNRDAGPDFFNSNIKIGGILWAGNVEIHVKASDWLKHGHAGNDAFRNVILHVVAENDVSIDFPSGSEIPTLVLQCSEPVLAQYNYLLQNKSWIPCSKHLKTMDRFTVALWLEKTGIERLELRAGEVLWSLEQNQGNWEEVLYRAIARTFGFHINSQPFELLARSLPYKILENYTESILQTEALIFGQAGFLNDLISYEDYYNKLQKEYRFLAHKHSLKPMPQHLWKFLRLRPVNFPTIRLAQFAMLIKQNRKLFASVKDSSTIAELLAILNVCPSEYWSNHYLFGRVSRPREKWIGDSSADILLINAIIPVLFVYGKTYGQELYQNRALEFLEQIGPEKNHIIENWTKHGIRPQSAFQSQALLHLKNEYCDSHRCLECQIGSKILTQLV